MSVDPPEVHSPPENSPPRDAGRAVATWLPTLASLRGYGTAAFRADLVAGIVLSAIMVPAAMGYAQAAGLPAITGLYATVGPLIAYFLVGPSRILVMGPDSALIAPMAATIIPLAGGDAGRSVALAAALALMVGVVCIAAAAARLGFLTDLLSRPVRVGYMNGIALTVIVSQVPKLLGFSVSASDFLGETIGIAQGVLDGRVVPVALLIGAGSLVVILVLRRVSRRFPAVLIAVVLATLAVTGLRARQPARASSAQSRAASPPPGSRPSASPTSWRSSPARSGSRSWRSPTRASTRGRSPPAAARRWTRTTSSPRWASPTWRPALIGGFPISSSATRTPVAEAAGARTQVTGLVGAGVVILLLVAVPGLLTNLPSTALGAIVIAAALSLFEVAGVRRLLAPPPVRVRAVRRQLPRRRRLRRPARDRDRRGPLAPRLHPARLAAARRDPRSRPELQGLPRRRAAPGRAAGAGPAPVPLGRAALLRQRGPVPAIARARSSAASTRRSAGSCVSAEPVTDVDTTAADVLDELITDLARARHRAPLRGDEGARQGPPQGLRDLPAAGRRWLPPDRRDGRQGVPGRASRPLAGLGGCGRRAGAAPP